MSDYDELLARLDVRQERGDVPEAATAIRTLLAERQAGKAHPPSCCCAECAKDWMSPTEIALAIGEEAHKRTGVTPALREVMQLRRDNLREIADTLPEVEPAIEAARQAGWNDAIEAAAKERAAIVAWLRAYKRDDTNWPQFLATAIEAGQHLGDSPTSPDDV